MNAVCADSNNNIIVAGVTIESGGLADYITLWKYDTNGGQCGPHHQNAEDQQQNKRYHDPPSF